MAKKAKTIYVCQNCGHNSPKWQGKCSSCEEWNTFVEEVITPSSGKQPIWDTEPQGKKITANKPRPLNQIAYQEEERFLTGDTEFDRVLGGGIMPGSVVLIGGEPGIGKSTLTLQLALEMPQLKILYVSGEESGQQIKMRAARIKNTLPDSCLILTETNTQAIFQQVKSTEPNLLIIDSIQTLHSSIVESAAGSVSQVRECAAELISYAKETGTPVFLIGHITKEGSLAGPKVLEHMVDTVLQFEGDRHMSYRVMRTTKNRFGSTSELGIYEMQSTGLRQVSNPSEILLTQREEDLSGITIGATLEGNRPLLVEIQSLVSSSVYGNPQRSCTGFDSKRLNMLLAVLEKRGGYRLGLQDVFLNITGGLKIEDPSIDLAVCASIISSFEDVSVSSKMCFAAEVGLGGEIRAIPRIENRISEAEKLGFEEIFISKYNKKGLDGKSFQIKIIPVAKLEDVFGLLF
ncbi:DNA repair protein RadA [Flammeovirgaceae bacterium SG7u.111]|nr:DNA repair protein RadA [Flammeovirgaceae bacterium SG7u.132]WPO35888.1 DNA repair protein RadA [Flammeovirgaceae bacterium SG7u.111]